MSGSVALKNKSNGGISPLRNQDGFVVGGVIFMLALVGAWFLFQSYKQGQLQSNVRGVVDGYISLIKR